METKKFSQFGTFSVVIMVPIVIFCLIMMIISGMDEPAGFIILGFVNLTLIICLLIFYKITIYVNESYVMFILGSGLVRKKYPLSEIRSCRAVRNSPIYGIGIRKIPKGWLYNVSGLGAIELTFNNRNSVVRIGTKEPEKVAESINKLIGYQTYEIQEDRKEKPGYMYFLTLLIISVFLPLMLIVTGGRQTETLVNNDGLTIKGIYGLNIRFSDISVLDTIKVLPTIKSRTNGYAFGKILKGNFKLSDNTKVKLFIRKENPPYIYIKGRDLTIYLNLTDPGKTISLFSQLQQMTNLQSE